MGKYSQQPVTTYNGKDLKKSVYIMYIYLCVYICMCVHIYVYICVYIYTHMCIYMYTHTCVHTHTHTNTQHCPKSVSIWETPNKLFDQLSISDSFAICLKHYKSTIVQFLKKMERRPLQVLTRKEEYRGTQSPCRTHFLPVYPEHP